MDFQLYFQILRGRDPFFFFKIGSNFFCQMACIYLLNSRGGPQWLDFVITIYSYPLFTVVTLATVVTVETVVTVMRVMTIVTVETVVIKQVFSPTRKCFPILKNKTKQKH